MRWADWIMEQPLAYALWQAPFVDQKFAPVERELQKRTVRRVLDVGCGPGTNASRFAGSEYVGVDINPRYIEIARARHSGQFVVADLATADIARLGQFDVVLVNSFLHHLPDTAVESILAQLPRALSDDGRVHILELVRPAEWSGARLMAALDRGRYARSEAAWIGIFERHFERVVAQRYSYAWGAWAMIYFQGKRPR